MDPLQFNYLSCKYWYEILHWWYQFKKCIFGFICLICMVILHQTQSPMNTNRSHWFDYLYVIILNQVMIIDKNQYSISMDMDPHHWTVLFKLLFSHHIISIIAISKKKRWVTGIGEFFWKVLSNKTSFPRFLFKVSCMNFQITSPDIPGIWE